MSGGVRAVLQGELILIVHMFCVGLPIALSVSRSAPKV